MEDTFRRMARGSSRLGKIVEEMAILNREKRELGVKRKALITEHGRQKYREMAKDFPVDKVEGNGGYSNSRGYEEFDAVLREQADSPFYIEHQIGKVKKKREELRKLNGFMGYVVRAYCFLFR